jgi:hypothetical protein
VKPVPGVSSHRAARGTPVPAEPEPSDWAGQWQGGLCPVGALGGLPIRGNDYAASPTLDRLLTLPGLAVSLADRATATAAWSAALGAPVVLARGLEAARAALLAAAGVEAGEPVGLPANATRALVEAVKARGARPRFLPLDPWLALAPDPAVGARLVWAQPTAGLTDPRPLPGASLVVDHGDTLPTLAPPPPDALATLWGLYLSADQAEAGALIALAPGAEALAERVGAWLGDGPDPAGALAQLGRLTGPAGLAARQSSALAQTWRGLREAAGLDLLPPGQALAHGVAVQVPAESEPSTFYCYARGENTPARWLPELRPVHYAAVREPGDGWRATAAHLARWLIVPVGPDYSPEEVSQAVLAIVKASDYLGVRWRADPARAARYARAMVERYGPGHDAYRPIFALG